MQPSIAKQAFTLPEVIITAMLLLIVMAPISKMAYSTLVSTKYSRDLGSAISIGQEKLESFAESPYASISAGTSSEGKFSLSWTVTTQDTAKIVEVTVTWDIAGKTRSMNVNSIFVQEGTTGFSL